MTVACIDGVCASSTVKLVITCTTVQVVVSVIARQIVVARLTI